jgi:hypothetical protein
MRALVYAWQEAVASLARARWTLLLSIATIAVAFAMLGAFRVVSGTVERVAGGWSEAAEVSVYLDDVVTEAEQAAIRQVIERSGITSGVTLVSKEQALARFGASRHHSTPIPSPRRSKSGSRKRVWRAAPMPWPRASRRCPAWPTCASIASGCRGSSP